MDRDKNGRFIKGHSLGVRFQKGCISWMKGKHPSKEVIEKIRQANLGSKHSEETKRKIGLAHKGFKHSVESKLKISKARKGIKFTDRHIENLSKSHIGKQLSETTKQKQSEALKGSKSYLWRGGVTEANGYVLLLRERGYVLEHRIVMEEFLGRELTKYEVVHHINFDKKDNRIENLMLFATQSEHMKFHNNKVRGKLIDESCLLHNNI